MTAVLLQRMHGTVELLNEKLRQAVYNSHVLASKLEQDRETIAALEQQLTERHALAEKRQHDCVLLRHELKV
jgi:hypothetical protein